MLHYYQLAFISLIWGTHESIEFNDLYEMRSIRAGHHKKYINISIYWSSLGVFLPTARESNVFQACVILSMVEGVG